MPGKPACFTCRAAVTLAHSPRERGVADTRFLFTQRCWNRREPEEQTAFVSDCFVARFIGLIFTQAME